MFSINFGAFQMFTHFRSILGQVNKQERPVKCELFLLSVRLFSSIHAELFYKDIALHSPEHGR